MQQDPSPAATKPFPRTKGPEPSIHTRKSPWEKNETIASAVITPCRTNSPQTVDAFEGRQQWQSLYNMGQVLVPSGPQGPCLRHGKLDRLILHPVGLSTHSLAWLPGLSQLPLPCLSACIPSRTLPCRIFILMTCSSLGLQVLLTCTQDAVNHPSRCTLNASHPAPSLDLPLLILRQLLPPLGSADSS